MLPLLREGKDLFTVRKKGPERCKKGDVALYRRGDACVLHRVIEVRPDDYVICLNAVFDTMRKGLLRYTMPEKGLKSRDFSITRLCFRLREGTFPVPVLSTFENGPEKTYPPLRSFEEYLNFVGNN